MSMSKGMANLRGDCECKSGWTAQPMTRPSPEPSLRHQRRLFLANRANSPSAECSKRAKHGKRSKQRAREDQQGRAHVIRHI
jgi:hypothetical protein